MKMKNLKAVSWNQDAEKNLEVLRKKRKGVSDSFLIRELIEIKAKEVEK